MHIKSCIYEHKDKKTKKKGAALSDDLNSADLKEAYKEVVYVRFNDLVGQFSIHVQGGQVAELDGNMEEM